MCSVTSVFHDPIVFKPSCFRKFFSKNIISTFFLFLYTLFHMQKEVQYLQTLLSMKCPLLKSCYCKHILSWIKLEWKYEKLITSHKTSGEAVFRTSIVWLAINKIYMDGSKRSVVIYRTNKEPTEIWSNFLNDPLLIEECHQSFPSLFILFKRFSTCGSTYSNWKG